MREAKIMGGTQLQPWEAFFQILGDMISGVGDATDKIKEYTAQRSTKSNIPPTPPLTNSDIDTTKPLINSDINTILPPNPPLTHSDINTTKPPTNDDITPSITSDINTTKPLINSDINTILSPNPPLTNTDINPAQPPTNDDINSVDYTENAKTTYGATADTIRKYIGRALLLSKNAEVKKISVFALAIPNIELCLLFKETTNEIRLQMISDFFAKYVEKGLNELLNDKNLLDMVTKVNDKSNKPLSTKLAGAGISAFLNDSDVKPINPQLLHVLRIMFKLISMLTGNTSNKDTKPYKRGVSNYMADIPYTVAKKAVVIIPPLSVPYGMYKTATALPAFATLMQIFELLLNEIDNKLESPDTVILGKLQNIYKNNNNKRTYDTFINNLNKVVLPHVMVSTSGGRWRRYTRKNKRGTKKRKLIRTKNMKRKKTRRYKS